VQNRLVRLRKKVEADMGGAVSASPVADGVQTAGAASEISTGSPKKRKAAPRKKGDESPKKVKPEPKIKDEDEDMV
jgi:hypothetical protein